MAIRAGGGAGGSLEREIKSPEPGDNASFSGVPAVAHRTERQKVNKRWRLNEIRRLRVFPDYHKSEAEQNPAGGTQVSGGAHRRDASRYCCDALIKGVQRKLRGTVEGEEGGSCGKLWCGETQTAV